MIEHIEQYKHAFEQWLILHPLLAGVVVFLLSLFESIAVIGMLLPGSVLMTICGTLIGAQLLPATPTLLWAIAGAVIGDGASYAVGYHYKERLRDVWPFYHYPSWVTNSESFFKRHGGKSVFLGRLGPLRAFVPIVAGMLSMRPLKFFIANIPASILWAPSYMLPGILLGMASLQLPAHIATRFLLYLFAAILILWACGWLLKRIIQYSWRKLDKWLDRLWQYCQQHKFWHPLCTALQDPLHPEYHGQLTSACVLILFAGSLICLIALVMQESTTLLHINHALHFFFRSWYNETVMKMAIVITTLGDKLVLLPMAALTTLFLVLKRQFYTAWHWLAVVILASGGVGVLKHVAQASRPTQIEGLVEVFSFPSGHTALCLALWGFLAVIIARVSQPKHRYLSYLGATIIVFSVAISRLYLGAHWLSDIIGGLLLGTCCLLVTTISYRRQLITAFNPISLILTCTLSFAAITTTYLLVTWKTHIQYSTPQWPTYTINAKAWWNNQLLQLPLFRPNRFGHAVQLLNVQWRGDISTLKDTLTDHDWQPIDDSNLQSMLHRLAARSLDRRLPLLPVTYLNHRPELIMIKPLASDDEVLLILRLWDANMTFDDTQQRLWLGAVDYAAPRDHIWTHWHRGNKPSSTTLPAVLPELKRDLSNLRWQVVYRRAEPSHSAGSVSPQYPVLLIQR